MPFPSRCRLGKGTAAAAPCRLQDEFAVEDKSPLARYDVTTQGFRKICDMLRTHSCDVLRNHCSVAEFVRSDRYVMVGALLQELLELHLC